MEYIHIAGTTAKGSLAKYMANILQQENKTGLFTSPHLFSVCERFIIDDQKISGEEYETYYNKNYVDEKEHLFCVWTKMAINWFLDNKVDYAVMETGLGGRKDPTNMVDAKIQILTLIGYDHMAELGDTLEEIAYEKCGIIKKNGVVFSYPQKKEVMDVIEETCVRKNAKLYVLDAGNITVLDSNFGVQKFSFEYGGLKFQNVQINSISPAQINNACLAIMVAVHLGVQKDIIISGIKSTEMVARAQLRDDVLIDGAHNESSMIELNNIIKSQFKGKNITVLFATMQDKDIKTVAMQIKGFADSVFLTCADKNRGMKADEVAKYFDDATIIEEPKKAYDEALKASKQKKGLLVLCGSFYLAAYGNKENK